MINSKSNKWYSNFSALGNKIFEYYFNEKIDFKIENSRRGEPDFLLSNIEKANTL